MNEQRPFDLVVLDLDGTIIDPYEAGDISPRVVETIAAVQAAGVPVTIGTGRTLVYVRAHISKIGITTPVVTTQGALIGDPVSGAAINEIDMPLGPACELAAWIDKAGCVATFYFSDKQGSMHLVQNHVGEDRDFEEYALGKADRIQPFFVDLFASPDISPPIKCIMLNDPRVEEDSEPLLQNKFGPALTVTRTHEILVETTAPDVDKGNGLRHLCELLNLDPARVLAIGDSENDIPMLKAAGCGVAMGNASARLKAVADWIAPSISADGAAVAMEKFILGK